MTTATATKETEGKASQADAGAILFELEGIAAGGRRATFDALKKALADQDLKLAPVQFSRFCLHPSPDSFIEELGSKIGAKKFNAGKALEAVNESLAHFFSSSKPVLNPGLAKILDAAHKHGLEAAAITSLPEDAANKLLNHLGLAEKGVRVFPFADVDNNFPRADFWLKVARQLGKSPRACVVVADHMVACKTALSASMKCLAVPNEFTSHQDYCGADLVLDSWDEMSAREILEAVAPAK